MNEEIMPNFLILLRRFAVFSHVVPDDPLLFPRLESHDCANVCANATSQIEKISINVLKQKIDKSLLHSLSHLRRHVELILHTFSTVHDLLSPPHTERWSWKLTNTENDEIYKFNDLMTLLRENIVHHYINVTLPSFDARLQEILEELHQKYEEKGKENRFSPSRAANNVFTLYVLFLLLFTFLITNMTIINRTMEAIMWRMATTSLRITTMGYYHFLRSLFAFHSILVELLTRDDVNKAEIRDAFYTSCEAMCSVWPSQNNENSFSNPFPFSSLVRLSSFFTVTENDTKNKKVTGTLWRGARALLKGNENKNIESMFAFFALSHRAVYRLLGFALRRISASRKHDGTLDYSNLQVKDDKRKMGKRMVLFARSFALFSSHTKWSFHVSRTVRCEQRR